MISAATSNLFCWVLKPKQMTRHPCYGNIGFQVFKGGILNYKDFWPKINILKENYCILWNDIAVSCQKLGIILENKMFKKLKLSKKTFYKKCAPKLIVLNEKKNPEKFHINFWHRNLTLNVRFLHFLTTRHYVRQFTKYDGIDF